MINPGQASFAAGVLRGIGAPVTPHNIAGFVGWAQAEGGWGHHNPLNTTQGAPGASNFNSVGVKAYPNDQVGINATIQTLKNGNYGGILQAFKANNPHALAGAIGASPWGTSGSLAAQTIAAALGQSVPNVANIKPTAPGQRPAVQQMGTTTKTVLSGGNVDHAALAQAVLAKEAAKPISTTGAPTTSNPLKDYVDALRSGQFTTPVSSHTITTTAPTNGSLRGGTLHHLTNNPGNINPLGAGWTIGRTDQGVDANAAPGTPIHAIHDSRVVAIQHNWYAGQPIVLMQLTNGPDAGKYWYVAEQISQIPHVGQVFKQGDVVARYAPSGTGIEIGWGSPKAGGLTLAQAQGQTGDASHGNAPAGIDFRRKILKA